jgi:hypothetical protein
VIDLLAHFFNGICLLLASDGFCRKRWISQFIFDDCVNFGASLMDFWPFLNFLHRLLRSVGAQQGEAHLTPGIGRL